MKFLYSVKISVVLVDSSGKPIDALDSEKVLEESGSLEVLKQATGLQIASISPLNSDPRQQQTQEGRTNTLNNQLIVYIYNKMFMLCACNDVSVSEKSPASVY